MTRLSRSQRSMSQVVARVDAALAELRGEREPPLALARLAAEATTAMEELLLAEDELRRALETRGVIERAKDVLMHARGISADDAFAVLRTESQHRNRKLRDVALDVTEGSSSRRRTSSSDATKRASGANLGAISATSGSGCVPRQLVSRSAPRSAASDRRPGGAPAVWKRFHGVACPKRLQQRGPTRPRRFPRRLLLVEAMSAIPLEFSTSVDGNGSASAVVVHVDGELDRSTSAALRHQLFRLLANGRHELVLDVEDITFLDLGGYRMLEEVGRHCLLAHGRTVLGNPGLAVRRLIEMVGLPAGVEVVPAERSAGATQ